VLLLEIDKKVPEIAQEAGEATVWRNVYHRYEQASFGKALKNNPGAANLAKSYPAIRSEVTRIAQSGNLRVEVAGQCGSI